MTSAFPSLLPPVPYDLQFAPSGTDAGTVNYFLDGGIYAGDPTTATFFYLLQTLNGLQNIGIALSDINCFISIGCGAKDTSTETYANVANWGGGVNALTGFQGWWLDVVSGKINTPLLDLLSKGPNDMFGSLMSVLMPGKFFRLQTPLSPNAGMPYDSAPATVAQWISDSDAYVKNLQSADNGSGFTWQSMLAQLQAGLPTA